MNNSKVDLIIVIRLVIGLVVSIILFIFAFTGSFNAQPVQVIVSDSSTVMDSKLSVNVNADKYQLVSPGEVYFTIKITNSSNVKLSDLKVSEKHFGDIGTIESIINETKTIEKTLLIDKTTQIIFTVLFTNPDRFTTGTSSDPITITIG